MGVVFLVVTAGRAIADPALRARARLGGGAPVRRLSALVPARRPRLHWARITLFVEPSASRASSVTGSRLRDGEGRRPRPSAGRLRLGVTRVFLGLSTDRGAPDRARTAAGARRTVCLLGVVADVHGHRASDACTPTPATTTPSRAATSTSLPSSSFSPSSISSRRGTLGAPHEPAQNCRSARCFSSLWDASWSQMPGHWAEALRVPADRRPHPRIHRCRPRARARALGRPPGAAWLDAVRLGARAHGSSSMARRFRDKLFPGVIDPPSATAREVALLGLIGDGFRVERARGPSGRCARAAVRS